MYQTKADGIRMATTAIDAYERQTEQLGDERRDLERKLRQAAGDLERTVGELASGLLSGPTEKVVRAAAEETGALHLTDRLRLLEQQRDSYRARQAEIEAMDDYRERESLIHPVTGSLTEDVRQAESLYNGLRHQKERYEIDAFLWLYQRGVHQPGEESGFQRLWRVMTLADMREKRALETVRQRFEGREFTDLVASYELLVEKTEFLASELASARARMQAVVDLVEEHDALASWLDRYEEVSLEALRHDLAAHLMVADFTAVHAMVRKAGRILVARCKALAEKMTYYRDMIAHLDGEIRDRQNRCESIRRVRRTWRAKPYGLLRGNKKKWLVDVPEMKWVSTNKRTGWLRTMSDSIHGYRDYHCFNAFMAAGTAFLAYDAFALAAVERMPYEGFTRAVIPELDQFRFEMGMAGADYGALRDTLTEQGAALSVLEGWDGSFNETAALEASLADAALEAPTVADAS